jgi:hypothetical protein
MTMRTPLVALTQRFPIDPNKDIAEVDSLRRRTISGLSGRH